MQDNGVVTHRFVCVLNKKIELGSAVNALGHMAAGLIDLIKENKNLRFQDYIDSTGTSHRNISDNPFIVLKAKNSNKLRSLRDELIHRKIAFTDFTHTMIEGTYIDQHKQTNQTKEEDLEYYGVCFFAEEKAAKELTKSFSLFG